MIIEDLKQNKYYSNACGCAGADGNYSNAFGDGIKKAFRNMRRNRKIKQRQKAETQKQTAAAIKSISAASKNDTSLQDLMKATAPASEEKKGMSTGVKVAIGVGVVAVLVGGYFLIKHFRKGKK